MSKIPDIQGYLRKAHEGFEMECTKIKSFKDGAEYFFKKRHIPLCAFMLHQTFELLYRMTEIVFLGREKISHQLRNHHQLLLPYLPSLKTVFDTDHEYDMFLLEILNEAYLSMLTAGIIPHINLTNLGFGAIDRTPLHAHFE